MAEAPHPTHLWEEGNLDEGIVVKYCPEHENLLKSKCSKLRDIVETANLWPLLLQYGVLDRRTCNRMKAKPIREDQMDELIDHIERNPCWRLHAFLKACRDTKQGHVISLLGLDPELYSDGEPSPDLHESSASETTTAASTEFQMKAGLRMHAASYQRRLLRGNLFGFKHKTSYDTFPITECHIEQDLEIKRGGRIAAKDALKGLDNGRKPQTILLSGPPGAGKTTVLEAIAHQWSEEHDNHMNNQKHSSKPNHAIVVYAPAMDMKGDVWCSIERSICCIDEDERKYIIQHLRQDVSSAILFDALDEIRDDKLLSELEHFIEENFKIGGPQILVSARTGLSRLKNEIFDRSLQLEGFTLEQGLQYIELFFQSILDDIYTATEDNKGVNTIQPNEILSYVRKNKERMKVILCNPLRVHILCGLAAHGVLKLDGDNILKPLYLLKCLEEYFIRRETKGDQVPEQESINFFRMCLHGLLTNIRHFTLKDLDKFEVSPASPYMAFFNTCAKPDESANEVAHYSFVHETFFEFFAVRCIEVLPDDHNKAVILSLCSEDVLQNVRVMICQMFSQYETKETSKLVIGMIKTMLLYVDTEFNGVSDILTIRQDIEMNVPKAADLLLQQSSFDAEGFSFKVNYVWEQIETQFAELNDELKRFWADVLFSHGMEDICECVSEFYLEQQINIINNTIYRLLPFERFSEDGATCVYPTGKLRWSKINHHKNTISVVGFCLSDCLDALLEHHTKHLCPPDSTRIETNRINHVSLEVKDDDHGMQALFDSEASVSSIPKERLRAVFIVYEDIISIVINFGYGTHYLLNNLIILVDQVSDMVIKGGQISLEDFCRWWCESDQMYQGRKTLKQVEVVLPDRVLYRNKQVQREQGAVSGDLSDGHSSCVADYADDEITLSLLGSPSISLLDYLETLGGRGPDIVIWWGHIRLEDFHRWWCEAGHKYKGRITLYDVKVVFPDRVYHGNTLALQQQEAVSGDLSYGDSACYADYAEDKLTLGLDDSPCIGLLDYLVTLGDRVPDIVIRWGEISLEDFHRWWCESSHKYQGRITLMYVDVVLPDRVQQRNKLQQERGAASAVLADRDTTYFLHFADDTLTFSDNRFITPCTSTETSDTSDTSDTSETNSMEELNCLMKSGQMFQVQATQYEMRVAQAERELVHSKNLMRVITPVQMDSYECETSLNLHPLGKDQFSFQCIGLLDDLVTLGDRVPDIVIRHGSISLEDLHRWWCELRHKYQGKITLKDLKVVLPDRVHHRNKLALQQQEVVSGDLSDQQSRCDVLHADDKLTLILWDTPCIGLLDYMVTLGDKGPDIVIEFGNISLEDFHRWWCESGQKYERRITLQELKVVLPIEDECRKQLIQWVRQAVSEELAEKMGSCVGLHEDPIHLGDKLEITGLVWCSPEKPLNEHKTATSPIRKYPIEMNT